MNGVEILTTKEVFDVVSTFSQGICSTLIVLGFVLLVSGAVILVDRSIFIGAIAFFLGVGCFFLLDSNNEKVFSGYEYKVTISDDVNFNEFIEKYEIKSQEGKIYTVFERSEE